MSGIITVYEQNSRSTQTSPILFAPYRQKSPAPLLSRSTQTSQLDYVAHNTLLYSEKDILETPIRHTGHSWSRSYHTRTLSRTRRRSHSVDSDIISTHGLHSRSSAYSRDRGSIRDRSFSLIKQRRRDSSLSLDSRRNTRHRSFSSESRRRRRRRRDRSSSLERRRRRRDRSISLDSHRRKGRDRSISVDIKRRRGRSPSVSYRGRDRSFSVDNRRRGDRSLSVDYRRRDRFASLKRNRRRDRSSSLDIRRRRGRTSSTDSRKSLGRRKQRNRYESLSSQPSWRDSRINRHRERSTSIAAHKDQKRKDDLLLKYDISRDERRRDTKRDRSHSVRKNKLSPIRRDDVNDNRKEQEEYPQQRRHSHHTEVTENNMNTPKRDSSIASTRHQIEADGLSIPEYDDSSKTADLHTNEDIPLQRKRKRSSSISRNEQTFNTVAQAKSTESNKKSCRERRKERQLKRRQRELKEKQLDDDMKITQLANIINNSNTSTQSTNEGSSALSSEDTIAIEVVDAELNDIHNTSEISKGKTATPPNMNVDTTPAIDSLLIPGTNESPVNTSSTFKEKTQASPTNTHSSTERKPKEPTAYTSSEATKESIVAALAFLENHAASSSLPYEKNKNQLTNTTSSSSGNSNGSSIVIPPLIREKPRKPNKKVTKKPVEITPPANNTPTTPRYNSRYVHNSTKASIITPPRNDRTKSNNTQSAQNDTKKAHTITPPVNGNNQPLRGTIEADIGPSRYYKNKSVVFNSPTTSRNKCKNNSVTIIADGISSNTPKTNSIPGTPGSGIIIFSASETSNTKDRTEGSEDINDRAPLSQEAINPPSYNNPCPTSVPREALGSNNPETIHSIPPPLNSMQFTPTNYPAPEFIPSTLEANNPNAGGRYACYSFPTVYPQNNMFTAGHELSNEAFNAIPHQINELPVFTGTNFASYPTFGNNYNMTFIQPNPIGLQEVSVSQPKNTEPYVNTHTEDISESCKIAQSKISRDTTDHILSIEASQPASENNMSELSMPLTIKKEEPDIVEIYSSDNESVSSKYPEIDISNINEIDEVDELSSIHPNEDSYQPQSVAIKQSENIEQDLDSLSSGQSVIIKQSEPASDSQPDNLETHGQGEPEQHIVSMVEEERRSLIKNLCFEIDPLYQKILKIHQLEGLKFLWNHVYEKRQGCLLCHAMGLGKTLQIIALLSTMYRHLEFSPDSNPRISKRVLILAPLITLVNWSNEFTKWATDDFEANVGCVYNISVAGFSDPSVRLCYQTTIQPIHCILTY
ncbi:hypothetical protein BDB01DRAFT_124806 [Pilobolus umbonatus]|nr:hypothetical protein BDB01DRAFT_124806 [Pilobolus umbonatus]